MVTFGLLFEPFDDAEIALGGVVEHLERRLIAWAVMGGDGLRDALDVRAER